MTIINSIAMRAQYFAGIRQELHQHPELMFETKETAARVVRELKAMGIERIETGVAKNGVIAVIEGERPGPNIGLRADMDALPIEEATGAPYASKNKGVMHACGHDGHTASLLAAADYLSQNRNFKGNCVLIFQPAEEGGGGARVMVEEGVLDRYDIAEIYAWHNYPNHKFGHFEICEGPILASTQTFDIHITGKSGHAASPHQAIDPIPVGMRVVDAIYNIKSRMIDPLDPVVISVTQFHAGSAENIIPDEVFIQGTIRTFSKSAPEIIAAQMTQIVEHLPTSMGALGKIRIYDGYPATINTPAETQYAAKVATKLLGEDKVNTALVPSMGAEDFAFFLEKIPGAYGVFGAGDGPDLHNAKFNFNDELLPIVASWFVGLVMDRG